MEHVTDMASYNLFQTHSNKPSVKTLILPVIQSQVGFNFRKKLSDILAQQILDFQSQLS